MGHFFISSGLRDVGYNWINTDDGWDTNSRDANGKLQPNLLKFPDGIVGLTKQLGDMNLSFGIYTAESSVVCSGRPGSLFQEYTDAQTFVEWGVKLVKNDNCGEYSYGNARFHVFADAVASMGAQMIISTEPFSLIPNPGHQNFAHYWRTGNDISANWEVILNRIDNNDKWAPFAGALLVQAGDSWAASGFFLALFLSCGQPSFFCARDVSIDADVCAPRLLPVGTKCSQPAPSILTGACVPT